MVRKDVMALRFARKQTPELRTAAAVQAKAPGPSVRTAVMSLISDILNAE